MDCDAAPACGVRTGENCVLAAGAARILSTERAADHVPEDGTGIENLNEQVAERAGQRSSGRLLMTHPGVGPVTALALGNYCFSESLCPGLI